MQLITTVIRLQTYHFKEPRSGNPGNAGIPFLTNFNVLNVNEIHQQNIKKCRFNYDQITAAYCGGSS